MLRELRRKEIKRILVCSRVKSALPGYEDEERWQEIISNPMLEINLERYKERLDRELEDPLLLIPASLYLNYRRTGSRAPHDTVVGSRRTKLGTHVVGECMERKGRFMDAIMDLIWAICEESSWVIPAHAKSTLPVFRDIKQIDLVSAGTALVFGETLGILGKRLDEHDPIIRERMVYELNRRCWDPYLDSSQNQGWLFSSDEQKVNNWNSVCNCGVVGSAILALDDASKLAEMIEKCLCSLNDYLRSFDRDGGSAEGASYWRYGVSHYVWLSYLLERRTNGGISLMDVPEMHNIALFPQRVTLTGQKVANFSDCPQEVYFPPPLMFYIGERLGMPEVRAFAQHEYDVGPRGFGRYVVRNLVWMPREPFRGMWQPESHVFFSDQQWLISRVDSRDPNSLILAAKGGNNGESHNQNDLGNFIVHFGGESLIMDLGSGSYTKDYFGPKRYEILVNSSWGHNVPLVNGFQQSAGARFAARVVEHTALSDWDVLDLELASAYPREAGIRGFRRRFCLMRRDSGFIEVNDRITLSKESGECICPIYTFGTIEEGDGCMDFVGKRARIRLRYLPKIVKVRIEQVDLKDDKFPDPFRRVVLNTPVNGEIANLSLRISGVSIDQDEWGLPNIVAP